VLSEERRTGIATAPVHHGEILQGIFAADGQLKRGLVTLPCDIYQARACFVVSDAHGITVSPSWKSKARRAAELTAAALREHGIGALGGHLDVTSKAPLGQGFGSSTSDVLVAIWAIADAVSVQLPAAIVAKLAVAAETASDSLMFEDSSVLFAHRDGEVIEDFGNCLPRMHVVGFMGRLNNGGVDTLALTPACYSRREMAILCELRSDLREAIAENNIDLLGRVATASAEINQRYLPIPNFGQIKSISKAAGSAGVQVSHSGNIAGLIFDPADPDIRARIRYSREMLASAGFNEQWQFDTDA
jgi:uncharacterized protein involved in propanediol utilization